MAMYLILCSLHKPPFNRTLGQIPHGGGIHDVTITCGCCGGVELKIADKPNEEGVYTVIGHTVRVVDVNDIN